MIPVAFWDSSALVPLCVQQQPTPQALQLLSRYRVAVWWSTQVEIASALAHLHRQRKISGSEFTHAKLQAEGLCDGWRVIMPSAKVASQACLLLERFPLRAADALQLAAALEWCDGHTRGRVLVTFDRRLEEAARSAGFTLP